MCSTEGLTHENILLYVSDKIVNLILQIPNSKNQKTGSLTMYMKYIVSNEGQDNPPWMVEYKEIC